MRNYFISLLTILLGSYLYAQQSSQPLIGNLFESDFQETKATESQQKPDNLIDPTSSINTFKANDCIQRYAEIPYFTGFESISLDEFWCSKSSTDFGRIQTTTEHNPYSGTRHLTMDVSQNGSLNTNEATLGLRLIGKNNIKLSFRWKAFDDEAHVEDGIYLSDNGGNTYVKVYELTDNDGNWELVELDISTLAVVHNLNLTNNFVVKFQQHDNFPIATDGFAFDEVEVTDNACFDPLEDNNTAAKAHNLGTVSTYNNSNLCLSNNDKDWLRFTYLNKDYYILVEGKAANTIGAYGLRFNRSANVINIETYSVNGSTTDTKLHLYAGDATTELAADDDGGAGQFSKLTYTVVLPTLTVNPTFIQAAKDAGNNLIGVTANIDWIAAETASWISVSSVAGSNSGNFIINYEANPTTFSRTATVTVSGGGITRTITITQVGIPVVCTQKYAGLPYSTGFENDTLNQTLDQNGTLGQFWCKKSSTDNGRVQITSDHTPYNGNGHLTMDVSTSGVFNTNEATLGLRLVGQDNINLSFWWKEFRDEAHEQDGIYFSDNGGKSYVKVYDLVGNNGNWEFVELDVSALISTYNLKLTDNFIVKFQQHDNFPIASDGFAFDDVKVDAVVIPPTVCIDPLENNNTANQAHNLGTASVYDNPNLCLTAGDKDWLRFFYNNQNYYILVEGSDTTTEGAYGIQFEGSGNSITIETYPVNNSITNTKLYLYDSDTTTLLAFDDNGGIDQFSKIIVTITPPSILIVTPTAIDVAGSAGNRLINVISNVNWVVNETSPWLSISETSGSSDNNFTINYALNNSSISRTAVVTVSGGGITREITVTQAGSTCVQNYAEIPYFTGFENSGLDQYWCTRSSTPFGQIQTSTSYAPYSGIRHLTMDVSENGISNTNEAALGLRLEGQTNIKLSFRWKEFSDEADEQDGVYFSDDGGNTYVKVYDLASNNGVWELVKLDISVLAVLYNLNLTNNFIVKFQQHDNDSIPNDGFAFDEVRVNADIVNICVDPLENNDTASLAHNIGTTLTYNNPDLCLTAKDKDWLKFTYLNKDYYILIEGHTSKESGAYGLRFARNRNTFTIETYAVNNSGTNTKLYLYDSDATTLLAFDNDSGENEFSKITYTVALPMLIVTPTTINASNNKGLNLVGVTSNVNWVVGESSTWISLSKTSGANNGNFIVIYEANNTNNSRTASIVVSGGGITRIITITQAGKSGSNKSGNAVEIEESTSLNVYPNPSSQQTNIQYTLSEAASVQLNIYDLTGKNLKQISQQHANAGTYQISVDVTDLTTGLYLVTLTYQDKVVTTKLIVE